MATSNNANLNPNNANPNNNANIDNNPFYFNQNAPQTFRQQQMNINQAPILPINVPSAKQISLSMRIQEKEEEYNNLLTLKKTSQEFAEHFDLLALHFEELNSGIESEYFYSSSKRRKKNQTLI